MTIKSLTITEDAYDALKAMKYSDESFSDTILRISQEKVGAVAKFFGILKDKPEVIKEMQKRIKENRVQFEKDFAERQKRFFGRSRA